MPGQALGLSSLLQEGAEGAGLPWGSGKGPFMAAGARFPRGRRGLPEASESAGPAGGGGVGGASISHTFSVLLG